MTAVRFLDEEEILWLHRRSLELHGGREGVRDRAALDAALAMPRSSFSSHYLHEDVFAMAAAYCFHLAQSQAFIDGNKRTALAAALLFLALNGYEVDDPDEQLYEPLIGFAEKTWDKARFAALLRTLARARD